MHAFWNDWNLKLPVARKLAVRHTSFVCLTASFLATGGFVKLFQNIPWFFHDYSGFFKFHDFSMHGTFLCGFPGFPWFPELVGTLVYAYQVFIICFITHSTRFNQGFFLNILLLFLVNLYTSVHLCIVF